MIIDNTIEENIYDLTKDKKVGIQDLLDLIDDSTRKGIKIKQALNAISHIDTLIKREPDGKIAIRVQGKITIEAAQIVLDYTNGVTIDGVVSFRDGGFYIQCWMIRDFYIKQEG